MIRSVLSLIACLILVVPAFAQTLYVPASANVEGVNQTRWRTDLQVKPRGDTGAVFTVELLETGSDNSDPLFVEHTLAAGESLRLGNALETEFGVTGTAALRITATQGEIAASSRTYNDDPAGTYGQTVPALSSSEAFGIGDDVALIQLSRSPNRAEGFRTNIGFVSLGGSQTALEIDLYRADGSHLGSLSRNLDPFGHRQVNDVFHAVGADDVADGYALVRTTSADGAFIAYASVVDNATGDAVFILGQSDDPGPVGTDQRLVVFESLMRPG
jgi:hypothetical protein